MGDRGAQMVAELVPYTDDGLGLDEAIAAYLAACAVEGKSPRTVDAYALAGAARPSATAARSGCRAPAPGRGRDASPGPPRWCR